MEHSKLSDHQFKKGKFITPFNALPSVKCFEDEKSWTYGRMPEYLWIGLVLEAFGRQKGLSKIGAIVKKLHEYAPNLYTARMSQILKLDEETQKKFYDYVILHGAQKALAPLTIVLTASKFPVFSKYFYCPDQGVEHRCEVLIKTMSAIMDHQSNKATDIRFVATYFNVISGQLFLDKNQSELLMVYPSINHCDSTMMLVRPIVRSLEMMILTFENADSTFLKYFWRCISEMTECNIYNVHFPEENRNVTAYMEKLHEIFLYLSDLFVSAAPLDEKMKVILGISTYSYKRLREIYEHQMFNSIAGRSCVRVLIEDYIMLKYLVKNEASHENIWREYQIYGIGAYKLVLARHRENATREETHFDVKYIEALVNEFIEEEFIDMDTSYFDKQNIRAKAKAVDEQSLYGLYYDYDSSFEHGMWGAVRESALLKCCNPAHQLHSVPDVNDVVRLKTTLPDCIMIMNKTISFLNDIYGIPERLLSEVLNFEIEPITE